jgi:hypothetical protein
MLLVSLEIIDIIEDFCKSNIFFLPSFSWSKWLFFFEWDSSYSETECFVNDGPYSIGDSFFSLEGIFQGFKFGKE